MKTVFGTDVRVLLCKNCGAPIEASLGGGTVACGYCSMQNQVTSRREEPIEPAAAARQLDEGQRLIMLRQQDGQPMLPPASLSSLLEGGGIAEWKIQEAVAVWQTTRREVESTGSFEAAERLLFLTIALANFYSGKGERLQQRAMFESALEVFSLPRHRQMMRGALARSAALDGDLAAAEQWLQPCNPRSEDLQSDTAYRISRATIDTARGDFNTVIAVLGQDLQQVPIMDAMEAIAVVLRANAWERMGQVQVASQQFAQYMGSGGASGRMALGKVLEAFARSGWQLCPGSYQHANASYSQQAGKAAAMGAGGLVGWIFYIVGLVNLVLGVLAVVGVGVYAVLAFTAYPSLRMGLMGAGMGGGIAGVTMIIIGAVFAGLGRGFVKSGQKAQRLRTEGLQARGQVVAIQPTGMTVNNVPQMRITVNVQLPDKAPYQATTTMLVNPMVLSQLMPGATVPLRVDPRNPQDFLIEMQ
jgi:hypothetical protein